MKSRFSVRIFGGFILS